MAKQNKPAIRFKGFTDAWEQRKLGEVVERITRKNENLESTLPLTISAQYGLIDQNEFFDKRIASKDVSGYFLVRNGEFAYNKSTSSDAPWGAIKRLDRYESGVLSTLYIVFKILDERKTSSDYIVTYYNTDLWHKGIQAIAAEGARNHGLLNVAPADFFETNLTMPKDYAEQQQIGSFFQMLDHLITLHQRKFDKLQVLKKAMLEKMFPKNGSSVPEIRFKGFTDAWEQRKFSDITFPAGEKNKENLPLESYSITNESGFVPQDEKFENGGTMREADKRMYYIVSPNSFAYNPARINVGSIGYQDTGKSVIVSSLYEVFKTSDDVDDRLLWHWFKSPDFQKLIMQLQEGGVRLYFYYDKLCMGQVFLPSLEEQRKIGKLFDTLDHLITLHQRELEKLQNIKKSMLEKMFV
jgi:type I restriction enzyme S subunit